MNTENENEELDKVLFDGPSTESFIDLSNSFYYLMNYRRSRNATPHNIAKKGRILREIKQFQFIQFDLQNCMISKERKQIQKDALFVVQKLSFLTDPQEVQQKQINQSINNDNQNSYNKKKTFNSNMTRINFGDDEDRDFYTRKANFGSLNIRKNNQLTVNNTNNSFNDNNTNSNNYNYNSINSNSNNFNSNDDGWLTFEQTSNNTNNRHTSFFQ